LLIWEYSESSSIEMAEATLPPEIDTLSESTRPTVDMQKSLLETEGQLLFQLVCPSLLFSSDASQCMCACKCIFVGSRPYSRCNCIVVLLSGNDVTRNMSSAQVAAGWSRDSCKKKVSRNSNSVVCIHCELLGRVS